MVPKYLRINNFLSHDKSEIDFDRFNMALILGTYDGEADQSNGTGKSSIFEAILWAIFDRSRHKKKNGVVKKDKRLCKVEYEFWLDNTLYKIIRKRDKIVSESSVTFEQWDSNQNKFQNIGGSTNTVTDRKISDIIGVDYNLFVNSVYFRQDDISIFATSTPGKRKDVLKSLLKLDRWDLYQNKVKSYAKILSTKIEEKSQQLIPMIALNKELEICKSDIAAMKHQIKTNIKKYKELENETILKKSQYQATYSGDDNIFIRLKKVQQKALTTRKRLTEINIQKTKNDETVKKNTEQISSLRQQIGIYKDRIEDRNKQNLPSLRGNIIKGQTKKNILFAQITELQKEIKLEDKCNLCEEPLTRKKIEEIKKRRRDKLVEIKEKYDKTCIKLSRINKKVKQIEKIIKDGDEAELNKNKTEVKISRLKNEIKACLNHNIHLNDEKKLLNIKSLEKEISNLKLKSNKNNKENLRNEIESLEIELKTQRKSADRFNIEYGSRIQRRDEITKLQKEQSKLQKEINKLNNQFTIYTKLRDYFGKNGIQSVIIENVIEELENYSNNTLAKICNEPTSISIKTQKQNDNGSWVETFDIVVKVGSRIDDFDTFSGGEKFRISLALRLALSNILSKRMGGVIQFLLLDEVSSNLDNKGVEMFIDIVKQLSSDIKILVVTHNERLKERFDDIIMVNKGTGGSRISFK